jgi:methyl-accepting chemotaxis protein
MSRHWTFGQKLGAGFSVVVLLALVIGLIAVYSLRTVVAKKDHVITVYGPLLVDAERLRSALNRTGGAARGYLLTTEDHFLDEMRAARGDFAAAYARISRDAASEEARRVVGRIASEEEEYRQAIDSVLALRRSENVDDVVKTFEEQSAPRRERLDEEIQALVRVQERDLEASRAAASAASSSAITLMVGLGGAAILLAAVIAFSLGRLLSRQIGSAAGQVQSSSAELQAAANQQATGAKEQATAMAEITTTISELLATSRQIAESAQRVSQIASQTATGARAGDGTVTKAQDAIAGIRRQVDLVVGHMLELGKKSQQIGAVLDIVSELAEQTNILAINATIEAVGAGETGKRFAVVADEIRKLADRVTGSTKEVRTLIEDVRSAVNTTVMATETGSKAVDTGLRHFDDVAAAFKHIGSLVGTTTEAGREIELSTKQQTTAVEQVNVAIANVAQATRETEASSGQTLQTASQLVTMSKDLLRLVEAGASA